jgi:phage terminase small subunit
LPGGRPKKPLSIKLLEGTFRECRDGGASQVKSTANGSPRCPTQLDEVGQAMWDFVCRERPEYLATSDAMALLDLCELWSLRAKAKSLAGDDPTNKDARCSFLGYQGAAEKIMAQFGLNPSDRAKQGELSQSEIDPAAEFIA